MRYFLTACAIALAAPALANPVSAIKRCMPAHEMAKALRLEYQQVRRFVGINADDQLFEIYASAAGNYTFVVTNALLVSCITSQGYAGNAIAAEPLGVDG